MFDWWLDLPAWARYGVALLILAIAATLFFVNGRIYPWVWGCGGAMLIVAMFVKDDWI
jgi:hypothetical protein